MADLIEFYREKKDVFFDDIDRAMLDDENDLAFGIGE